MPPPTRQDLTAAQQPYIIGPFDKLDINVYGVPELSMTVQVDAGGSMSLPLAGTVPASGKTPSQLANAIAANLRKYVRDPQVTVNTDEINQFVTVDGEVAQPGSYPVMGRMTLIRAIAEAKGMSQYSDENFVVVFREVDGKKMAALYDLRAIRQGIYEDPPIYAGDVVSVGESASKRTFALAVQGAGLLVAPLVAILN
ncbi:polysaccharide export protein [Stakelama sp. CBK3Z-3]|uniref:Polysaccharide export protein n=1 Tax=Stakelama flava TaxID=2860338 RepID=A0ABS6XJ81_9SPHN|nr:polysaccharide export protein [Stakelama flava]